MLKAVVEKYPASRIICKWYILCIILCRKICVMKTILKCLTGLIMSIASFGVFLFGHIKTKTQGMLNRIADEGYETAYDVLYPGDKNEENLHYGPVIPE